MTVRTVRRQQDNGGSERWISMVDQRYHREAEQRQNLLTIKYVPGHYQALVGRSRPTLAELCAALDTAGVLYVITGG